jgi:hypothetical protein
MAGTLDYVPQIGRGGLVGECMYTIKNWTDRTKIYSHFDNSIERQ